MNKITDKQKAYLKILGCKKQKKTIEQLSSKQASYLIWSLKKAKGGA